MSACFCLQILRLLPESLQRSVLAVAMKSCVELLSMLPEELHMAALHAKYPSIEHDSAIRISTRDILLTGPRETFWSLVTRLHWLKRVEIIMAYTSRELVMPLNGLTGVTSLTVSGFGGITDGVREIWPLGSLGSLQHLELSQNRMNGDDVAALVPELRQLTK